MADISKITLPSGVTYNIKDAVARETLSGAIKIQGSTTTALTDEATTNPIKINGANYTAAANDAVFYNKKEYVFDGTKWHEFGDMSGLGSLAYKDSASGTYTPSGQITAIISETENKQALVVPAAGNGTATYTPQGTITKPSFTGSKATISSTGTFTPQGQVNITTTPTSYEVKSSSSASGTYSSGYTPSLTVTNPTISVATAGETKTINNPTKVTVAKTVVAAAPGATAPANSLTYYSVANETLSLYQIGYTTGASITTSAVDVKIGDASYTATGTECRADKAYFQVEVPVATAASFQGTSGNVSTTASYTPNGSVGTPEFNGTGVRLTTEYIEVPSEIEASFSGTQGTVTVS